MNTQLINTQRLTKEQLKRSIVIVIETNGAHHIKLPADDQLEFDSGAYQALLNTLTVLNEPSFVLKGVLIIERFFQKVSRLCARFCDRLCAR